MHIYIPDQDPMIMMIKLLVLTQGKCQLYSFFSFTQEKKQTVLKKTDDPSPASYIIPGSTGVIPHWSNYEANPRPILESTTKR